VIDHHGQVALAALVADLVDPDPPQPDQPVGGLLGIGSHPGHDRTNRAPRHPQQLPDRRPGGVGGQPRRGVIKCQGVPGTMTRPRDRGDHDPMRWARNPWRVGLHERAHAAQVQRPPAPTPLTLVEPGTPRLADPTPPAGALAGPDRDHDRVLIGLETDLFDHGPLDAQQPSP
jgi:hypothetical protein